MLEINQEILNTILLAVLLFFILSIGIGLLILNFKKNQQRHFFQIRSMQAEFEKQLLQAQVEVQEATFSTLGRELHDNIGQLLSTTKMLLGLTERALPSVPDTLNTATETLGKAIVELRALTKSLTREWLEQFDFVENLTSEVARLNSDERLHVVFGYRTQIPLSPEKQIVLFRIVQEGLQNAVKHAEATRLEIEMRADDEGLRLSLSDNGKGFDIRQASQGIGMMNMQQRTRILGGTISWESVPGAGTTIHICLPRQSLDHEN